MTFDAAFLPKANKNRDEKWLRKVIYIFCKDFGWSWDMFINTPIPIILLLLQEHKARIEAERKANKKK
jgi:hypothetical protein